MCYKYSTLKFDFRLALLLVAVVSKSCVNDLTPLELPRPDVHVDGYVDATRGVYLSITEVLDPRFEFSETELRALGINSAVARVCHDGDCLDVPAQASGVYATGESLPATWTDSLHVIIDFGDSVAIATGLPPSDPGIRYDSLTTREGLLFADDPSTGSLNHEFTFATDYETGRITVLTVSTPTDRALATIFDVGAIDCIPFDFSDSYLIFPPACRTSDPVRATAANEIDAENAEGFELHIGSSFDLNYPRYTEALRQSATDGAFRSLYDILETEGNITGAGGYILFSNSRTFTVTAD